MFYASEADRVLQFTRRQLRDVWVEENEQRDSLAARDPRVRKAYGLEDGDMEGWRVIAEQRVRRSAALRLHDAIIWYAWTEHDHPKWVATAPEAEIISWADAVNAE